MSSSSGFWPWSLTIIIATVACQPNSSEPDLATAQQPNAPCVTVGTNDGSDGVPTSAENWPSFRGQQASGVSTSPDLPLSWDGTSGHNIKWRTEIPGLGLSSPVVWGDRLFITTAVGQEEPVLRTNFMGETESQPAEGELEFRLICLDTVTGDIVWQRAAHTGEPKTRRHPMSSHANPSVATDGNHVVAFFASEGLYAYDLDGHLLWQQDLGLLEASWFANAEDEWGFGSSPIISEDRVIVVCDVHNQSFIVAFALADGAELWRQERDEVPGWGSPTVASHGQRSQVIVNGFQHIGGYDVSDGSELWRMTGGGDIPVPTPILGHGLVFFTNSHGRSSPILAVSLDAEGDISLAEGTSSNQHVAWSKPRRGAYMPTPLVYGDLLYIGRDNGIVTAYRATTGDELYRERIGGVRASYTASAVAGCGRLYYLDDKCTTQVLAASEQYEHLASNVLDGTCLASPAIAGSTIYIRTGRALYAIAENTRITVEELPPTAPHEENPDRLAEELTGESNPARAILLRSAAALSVVHTVRYKVEVEPTDDAIGQMSPLAATVLATGDYQGFPDRFRVTGIAGEKGADSAFEVEAGSDGNLFFVIDHTTETVHTDFDRGVFGRLGWTALQGLISDLVADEPLSLELEGNTFELLEATTIAGEDCQVVHVTQESGYVIETTLSIATSDLLPRAIHRIYRSGEDGRWGGLQTISELEVNPEITATAFAMTMPEGFQQTHDRAP